MFSYFPFFYTEILKSNMEIFFAHVISQVVWFFKKILFFYIYHFHINFKDWFCIRLIRTK